MALWLEFQNLVEDSSKNSHEMEYSSTQIPQENQFDSHLKDQSTSIFNVTNLPQSPFSESIESIFIAVSLGIFILITVIGNFFVIFAIVTEKNLKGIANCLILSLAVADLMVAILVMPLSAYNEVNKQAWTLGPELCQIWTSLDVMSCTASILHLLAIAVDRYWAVTNVEYARSREPLRIYLLIGSVWTGAVIISIAPILGFKDTEFYERLEKDQRCLVSQNVIYQVFATCSSFYIPLIFILVLYWNIFKQARKRIRSKPGAAAVLIVEKNKNGQSSSIESEQNHALSEHEDQNSEANINRLLLLAKREKKIAKESTEAKRERKAAKTLMIITGAFVCCWLPFFIMALLMAVCEACQPSDFVFGIMLWLGYTNSLINPVIYTVFSPDFRNAFKRMLCGTRLFTQRN